MLSPDDLRCIEEALRRTRSELEVASFENL